jgi:hypothetical protein
MRRVPKSKYGLPDHAPCHTIGCSSRRYRPQLSHAIGRGHLFCHDCRGNSRLFLRRNVFAEFKQSFVTRPYCRRGLVGRSRSSFRIFIRQLSKNLVNRLVASLRCIGHSCQGVGHEDCAIPGFLGGFSSSLIAKLDARLTTVANESHNRSSCRRLLNRRFPVQGHSNYSQRANDLEVYNVALMRSSVGQFSFTNSVFTHDPNEASRGRYFG